MQVTENIFTTTATTITVRINSSILQHPLVRGNGVALHDVFLLLLLLLYGQCPLKRTIVDRHLQRIPKRQTLMQKMGISLKVLNAATFIVQDLMCGHNQGSVVTYNIVQ